MRKTLATLAILTIALPAGAGVDASDDRATITNTTNQSQTYAIQVYDGYGERTLAPGESYTFTTVDQGGHWAVWLNGVLVASGEFTVVLDRDGSGDFVAADQQTEAAPQPVDVDADTWRTHNGRHGGVYPI